MKYTLVLALCGVATVTAFLPPLAPRYTVALARSSKQALYAQEGADKQGSADELTKGAQRKQEQQSSDNPLSGVAEAVGNVLKEGHGSGVAEAVSDNTEDFRAGLEHARTDPGEVVGNAADAAVEFAKHPVEKYAEGNRNAVNQKRRENEEDPLMSKSETPDGTTGQGETKATPATPEQGLR